ncbi:MAG: hypothetical protein QM811_06940 [Pirellulales bacterium]
MRRSFPVIGRVTVRLVDANQIPGSIAEVHETSAGFVIRMRCDLSDNELVDALFHEWAHVRRWASRKGKDHNQAWAREFGSISAAYEAFKGNP